MAKTCWLEREKRKAATVAKYATLRAELRPDIPLHTYPLHINTVEFADAVAGHFVDMLRRTGRHP